MKQVRKYGGLFLQFFFVFYYFFLILSNDTISKKYQDVSSEWIYIYIFNIKYFLDRFLYTFLDISLDVLINHWHTFHDRYLNISWIYLDRYLDQCLNIMWQMFCWNSIDVLKYLLLDFLLNIILCYRGKNSWRSS